MCPPSYPNISMKWRSRRTYSERRSNPRRPNLPILSQCWEVSLSTAHHWASWKLLNNGVSRLYQVCTNSIKINSILKINLGRAVMQGLKSIRWGHASSRWPAWVILWATNPLWKVAKWTWPCQGRLRLERFRAPVLWAQWTMWRKSIRDRYSATASLIPRRSAILSNTDKCVTVHRIRMRKRPTLATWRTLRFLCITGGISILCLGGSHFNPWWKIRHGTGTMAIFKMGQQIMRTASPVEGQEAATEAAMGRTMHHSGGSSFHR